MLAASSAAAIAGDREERESNRRFLRFWLISTDGPKLGGDRASYLQVPPAPAPGAQGETLSPLSPMPEAYPSPTGPGYILPGPAPPGSGPHGPVLGGAAAELYPCVKYDDPENIPRCAVPVIVAVPDPRPKCDCDPSGCVYVKICVPTHCPPEIKVKKGGREIQYKWDDLDFEVEIKQQKKGWLEVDYDD
jgi:hypothetical protein